MTQSGPSQAGSPGVDQEPLWETPLGDAEETDAGPASDVGTPTERPAVPPPVAARHARTVGAGGGWAQSLTSTAAVPGPSGFVLADIPNRIIALVLDLILLAILGLLLALVLGGLFGGLTSGGSTAGGSFETAGGDLNVAAFLVVAIGQLAVSFGYFAYGWVMLRGTAGMKMLGLRVGDQDDGHGISWDQALVRWLLLGIPATLATFAVIVPSLVGLIFGLIGCLWLVLLLVSMAQSPSKQGLHDRRARTILVRSARRSG
jgi:RDD family